MLLIYRGENTEMDTIQYLNVEDYLNHENVTTETDMSGYSTITLNNIKDIKVRGEI